MLPSQDNSITYEQLNSLRFEYIQAELTNWERIVFQGDMDGSRKQGEASSNSGDHTSKPVSNSTDNTGTGHHFHGAAPPHVPPEAYNYLIHALLSMQGAMSPPAAQNQSLPYPQGQFPAGLSTSSVFPHVPHQAMHSNPPLAMSSTGPLSHFPPAMMTAYSGFHSTANEPSALASSDAPSDAGDITDEAAAIAEDKRRRNTSASARFRTKKKQKTLNLERTVSDLTGRTEELEREASELRRENSWLKEIVLLKSRRRGAFGSSQTKNSQQAGTSSAQGNGHDDDPSSDGEEEGHGAQEAN